MKVGVFDSGIGGLTVLNELIMSKPNNEYIYVGDNLHVPYGDKTKDELLKLSCKIIDYLISRQVDIIIIACGTVSSNLASILKKKYIIPIIDIISPTLELLKESVYKEIGVIATHMTINSKIFSSFLKDKRVYEIECPKLVPAIESYNEVEINDVLKIYLGNFHGKKLDVLVLGCTHYPIVANKIQSILGSNVLLFNMATPIIDMIKNDDKATECNVDINFTKFDDLVIDNIKRILYNIDYNLNLINLD